MVIGSLARRAPNPNNFCRNAQSLISFSTSSGGRGRGRADGSPSPQFSFSARVLGQPGESESPPEGTSLGRGQGHGHGRAQPSSPVLPSFTSFVDVAARSDDKENGGESVVPGPVEENEPDSLNVISALGTAGFGRGKPLKRESQAPGQEMNRHIRPERPRFENQINRNQAQPGPREAPIQEADRDARPQRPRFRGQDDMNRAQPVPSSSKSTPPPKMSKEDAVKNAKKILSRRDDDEDEEEYRGLRTGRGGNGRFRGRDNRFDDEYNSVDRFEFDDEDEYEEEEKYDEKEEERKEREAMIEMLGGEETYEEFQNTIEELVEEFLPDEDLLRAHDIDKAIEFEPEYAMVFNENPDIDEKPPVPLRDVLEKVKPFMMAYEGIESQEEWEQTIEETMKLAPTMKQLVDCYSGPDRVTAKRQVEELERVAKTLPQSAPASVQRFTDRALLSLQSNPGWAFGKKAQFMDKLVREFSQQRK